ncbi:MAG: hypothetical protein K0S46_1743 [Moraxellaceae bacterium]|jgi:predicted MPP superfamily phosphohydrolase|nr:hypothetical protein [Moraxellaceae bacterium]
MKTKSLAKLGSVLTAIWLAGCTALQSPVAIPQKSEKALRIAVIADTQVTSKEATSNYLFRTPFADRVVNVAMRTTAQEVLAAEHLGYMLDSLGQQSPDLVLYLGDGANSGCDDEIDQFFTVLAAARDRLKAPVFFVVGNHDYLATGNQAAPSMRALACKGGGYVTKAELVARTAQFNSESWQRYAAGNTGLLGFEDSLESVMRRPGKGCLAEEEGQQEQFCFYAAVLKVNSAGRTGDIILADSSDYSDVVVQPRIGRSDLAQIAGKRGSISWSRGGQTEWINDHASKAASADFRIIATHYPSGDLSWNRFWTGRPGDLMLGQGVEASSPKKNLWLSAHTHVSTPGEKIVSLSFENHDGSDRKDYEEINVGSTTDHIPHAAIVDVAPDAIRKYPVRSRTVEQQHECRQMINSIRLADSYVSPRRGQSVALRLGMTKAYRKRAYQPEVARRNIEMFLAEPGHASEREKWVRCLLTEAARVEDRFW